MWQFLKPTREWNSHDRPWHQRPSAARLAQRVAWWVLGLGSHIDTLRRWVESGWPGRADSARVSSCLRWLITIRTARMEWISHHTFVDSELLMILVWAAAHRLKCDWRAMSTRDMCEGDHKDGLRCRWSGNFSDNKQLSRCFSAHDEKYIFNQRGNNLDRRARPPPLAPSRKTRNVYNFWMFLEWMLGQTLKSAHTNSLRRVCQRRFQCLKCS